MTRSGGALVTAVNGGCDMGLNISVNFSISSTCPAQFDAAAGTLSFQADPSPQQHHSAHIPWYDYLLGGIPDLVMAIVVPLVANGIAGGLAGQMQRFSLAKSPPSAVRSAGLRALKVTAAQVMNGLCVYGDFPSGS